MAKRVAHNKMPVEEAIELFRREGLIPLFTEMAGVDTPLEYTCPNHMDMIFKKSVTGLRTTIKESSFRGCPLCARKWVAENSKLDFSVVRDLYLKHDALLLTREEDYVNVDTYLEFICNKHPHKGVQRVQPKYAKKYGAICKLCRWERYGGPARYNYLWSASITKHLRLAIEHWKKTSFILAGGTCDISGDNKSLHVHHLVPFNKLRDATLLELGYDLSPKTRKDLEQEELQDITSLFLLKHYEGQLGVVVRKDLHKMFHTTYGSKNFTPENYYEFKRNYLALQNDRVQ